MPNSFEATSVRPSPAWSLATALLVQAAIHTFRLGLLPEWNDEFATLEALGGSLSGLIETLAGDIHPPLYFVSAWMWIRLPGLGIDFPSLRLHSVLWGLAATFLLDRLWLRAHFAETPRRWCLAIWTLSPFLLLYARMGRSYSMQAAAALIAFRAAADLFAEPERRHRTPRFAAAAAFALYTHYLAGFAALFVAGFLALQSAHARRSAAPLWAGVRAGALAGVVYLPWLFPLLRSVGTWQSFPPYWASGNRLVETALKLTMVFVTFSYGEVLPTPLLIYGALLGPLVVLSLWSGMRSGAAWLPLAGAAFLLSYLGASGLVSFPFVAARMILAYPFFVMLLTTGAWPRWRQALTAALVAMHVLAIVSYFRVDGFLNKSYCTPFDEIAAVINGGIAGQRALVLLDNFNADVRPLAARLGPGAEILVLRDAAGEAAALDAASRQESVYFFRNTHDLSPGGMNERIAAALARDFEPARRFFVRYDRLDALAVRVFGWRVPAPYFLELTAFRRR